MKCKKVHAVFPDAHGQMQVPIARL